METSSTPILTPDQRLRVFVSSTLQELAEERTVVRQAIQKIHLTPVMFEMGARPHAPRNLYRQYLAQSQIFIGIYWDRYGWVAPDEQVSGLEDEYNLSGNMPKLIYIKKSSGHREDGLTQLLKRIQHDDKVSYKSFSTPEELSDLIMNDLALLLTERFNLTLQNKISGVDAKSFHSIPSIPNSLIGRDKEMEEIISILNSPQKRLVTLTGPGGIGKTRLATEIANRLQHAYQDGAAFVPLAPVRDSKLVSETICYALGIKISGGNTLDSLKLFLQDKKFLLVLDNFEQIIEAASIIDDLLYAAPGLKIIVTSRERLSLSFEHLYALSTLSSHFNQSETLESGLPPAVELFVQRAKAIQPQFTLTVQNKEIIREICERLEGLPLAIELASAQIAMFSPAMLLQKLDHRLDILKGNFRDIPDRQKTIRNTIEWSFELLAPSEQSLLLQISLYPAGSLIQTIEAMKGTCNEDVYELLMSLINKSLIIKQDEEFQVRFQMLESVREFAMEKLNENGQLELFLQRQADYYHKALNGIKLPRKDINQAELLKYLEKEHANIRQTLDFLMQRRDLQKIIDISWNLWLFWWVNAHTNEGYTWLKKAWEICEMENMPLSDYTASIFACNVGIMSFLQRDFVTFNASIVKNLDLILAQDDDELVATAMLITGVVKTIIREYAAADQMLDISLERFQKIGLTTGTSLALSALGRNAVYDGTRTQEAKDYYKESMRLAKEENNEISVIIALAGFAFCEVMEKNSDAKNYLRESILLSQSLHFFEALAWSVEIWALVSVNEGRLVHAVTLMGAVEHLRSTAKLPVWEDLQIVISEAKNQVQSLMDPEVFNTAWDSGASMTLDKMVAYTMEG